MALTYHQETSNGQQTLFAVQFDYLFQKDVYVYAGTHGEFAKQLAYRWADSKTIELLNLTQVPAGTTFYIRRIMDRTDLIHKFSNKSIRAGLIDQENYHALYLLQEFVDGFSNLDGVLTTLGNLNMLNNSIINLAYAVAAGDAVPFQQMLDYLSEVDFQGVIPLLQPRQKGDGTTVTFATPATQQCLAESFFINIDAAGQRPYTDFTANNDGSVTFAKAPPEGANIDITLFQPANFGDLSGAGVIATGTTKVRTLGDRFADVVNVKDFGAVGDGVADDAQAFRDALAVSTLTGTVVAFPTGKYRITGAFSTTGNTYLDAGKNDVEILSDEFKITSTADVGITGNFHFNFAQKADASAPSSSLVIDTTGSVELNDIEISGAWKNNAEFVNGVRFISDNVYSHDAGIGRFNTGLSNIGSGMIVRDFDEVRISNYTGKRSFQSNLFIWGTDVSNPVESVTLSNIFIDVSNGNGVRIQSDDTPSHEAIKYVNVNGVTTKNCDSHGIRTNCRFGVIDGFVAQKCNAGIASDTMQNMSYSNFVLADCNESIICRFNYGRIVDQITMTGITIVNPTTKAFVFTPAVGTTSYLGKLKINGMDIYCTNGTATAIEMNGGSTGYNFAEVTLSDVNIYGAAGLACITAEQIKRFKATDCNMYDMVANASVNSAYMDIDAQRATIKNCDGLNGDENDIERPMRIRGTPVMLNITNNVMPNTRNGFISYSQIPSQWYEMGNMTRNTRNPSQFDLTGTITSTRSLAVSGSTTAQELAGVVYAMLGDMRDNKFITRT